MEKVDLKKNILIGVCGGIAAYKTAYLVRFFIKNEYNVKVVMTANAKKFVRPVVFRALTNNHVYTKLFNSEEDISYQHVSLASWADILIIAPLTANTLSKITFGIADNLLTSLVLAFSRNKKIILAPAMNQNMWSNPVIQENINKLAKKNQFVIIPPEKGELACGDSGLGRMAEPEIIGRHALKLLHNNDASNG